MRTHRIILLTLALLLMPGSILASLGYATYLRSQRYRVSVETEVSDYLGLLTRIERVVPLSRTARQFDGISVWLPKRKTQVFHCQNAVWHSDKPGGGGDTLELFRGSLLVGDTGIRQADYEIMLRGGLGHDFQELGLSRVGLHDINIRWRRPGVDITVGQASGDIAFDDSGLGHATLSAHRLNDARVSDPIQVLAEFTPGASLTIQRVQLDVPPVPLPTLKLDNVLGGSVQSGSFDGTVVYRETGRTDQLNLRGSISDARLEELTRRIPGGPFTGNVNVRLDRAQIVDQVLTRLVFAGEIRAIRLSDLAPLFDQPDLDGTVNLRVHQAKYVDDQLMHLSADGDASDVSLDAITRLLKHGVITGRLHVDIDSLVVVDDRIRWADIRLNAVPPEDATGTIDRSLIVYAAETLLDIELDRFQSMLPEKVEYARMGCRLIVDRDQLHVRGTHGRDSRTMLTVRILGREFAVLKEPDDSYKLTNVLSALRAQLSEYDMQRVLKWWEGRGEPQESP